MPDTIGHRQDVLVLFFFLIFGIPLLIVQKQRIRIQNEDKSVLDLLYLCKKITEIEICLPLNKAQEKYFKLTEDLLSKRKVGKLILYTCRLKKYQP